MQRYSGAVRRYLIAVLQDHNVADDLSQDFAVRFLRGNFRKADPGRGRFRDYVKRSVLNLVHDYRRQNQKQPRALAVDFADDPESLELEDEAFRVSWRDEILERCWEQLRMLEETRRSCSRRCC